MAPVFEELLRSSCLDSIDALFAENLGQRLDKPGLASWRQRRRIVLKSDSGQETFYLKRFENPPASARRQVRRSETGANSVAGLEWTWMRRLHKDGIACVVPVALGEEFFGKRELRSALLTQAVPGDALERWMSRWNDLGKEKTAEIWRGVARLVSQLHGNGYVHRDLYLSHIFCDPHAAPEQSLTLIDLQRVLRPRWRKTRWIVKDLAALNYSAPAQCISRTRRLRWLLDYLRIDRLTPAGKRLAYRVIGKTATIARRKRQGVPLASAGASPSPNAEGR